MSELLFGDDFPSLTLNNSVVPEETPRLSKQCREILEKLKHGPATNRELSQISLKYTGRISDLRAPGFRIEIVERNQPERVECVRVENVRTISICLRRFASHEPCARELSHERMDQD